MLRWLDTLKRYCTPPRQQTIVDESGVTFVKTSRHGLPWNYRFEKSTSHRTWQEVIRVTAKRWDCWTVDTIGMEFEFQNIHSHHDFQGTVIYDSTRPENIIGIG